MLRLFFLINNYIDFVKIFNYIFRFLYIKYFSRMAFDLIYFFDYKIYILIDSLKIIKFINNFKDLRLIIKYREKVI